MEYLLYLSRFIYRIRWWLIIVPIVLTLLAVYSTKHMGRTYNTNTTVYTGIISGYTVEATTGAGINLTQQNTTLDNILTLITSKSTLERVSLRLYAENMMHGNPNQDNNYIQASTYNALLRITPKEVQKLIDKKDEKKTIANLRAYERPNSKNFIFGLFNWNHPDYSYGALFNKIKVNRIGGSDMIEIKFSGGDPGIAYNTLKILNEEFVEQYQELRFGETNNVIKFFEEELAKLSRQLNMSEDSLTAYSLSKRIINYGEQTKQVTAQNSSWEQRCEDFLLEYNSAKTLITELEKRMDSHAKSLRNNAEFITRMQKITDLTSKVTDIEAFNDENSSKSQDLKSYKKQLKEEEENFSNFAEKYSNQKYTKEKIGSEEILEQWFQQMLNMEKAEAKLKLMESRKGLIDDKYTFFSPIGNTLKRKDREIGFLEQNYMSMLNSLNTARLRQKNLQMNSATLRIINPPAYPLNAEATNRKSIVMTVFFGSILAILGFSLIIELLDRTLRDKTRTERLTSCKVIGAFTGNEIVRFRNFSKARNQIASKFLCNTLLNYLPSNGKRIINLLSTESGDGKSFIGKQLEEYWNSIGLNVKHISWNEDFPKDSREFLLAESVTDLSKSTEDTDILLVEYPPLKECTIPRTLINDAALNLVIARANKTWKLTDQLLLSQLKKLASPESPVVICLNKAESNVVESFTGLLPPYNKFKKIIYRFSQFGLTASE
ncbi:exopolysaccharide biosynthesis protein [uncultured Bacteroides sp.]|uniref:GumC family protein n=1 Tax=uncultured Bacteroides sp. TaxID=162156 RepID=UPI002AAB9B08|nr:exopolysaccharide biosynthesis protein [uncultured Bacteroides sp.]